MKLTCNWKLTMCEARGRIPVIATSISTVPPHHYFVIKVSRAMQQAAPILHLHHLSSSHRNIQAASLSPVHHSVQSKILVHIPLPWTIPVTPQYPRTISVNLHYPWHPTLPWDNSWYPHYSCSPSLGYSDTQTPSLAPHST